MGIHKNLGSLLQGNQILAADATAYMKFDNFLLKCESATLGQNLECPQYPRNGVFGAIKVTWKH